MTVKKLNFFIKTKRVYLLLIPVIMTNEISVAFGLSPEKCVKWRYVDMTSDYIILLRDIHERV